jgi:hypothetical protein
MARPRTKLSIVSRGDGVASVDPADPVGNENDDDLTWPAGMQFPDDREGCDDWCAPLHIVETALRGKPWAKFFDVDDFMIMSRLVDATGTVTHYKHYITRSYINVDNFGGTYTYNERHWQQEENRYGYSGTQRLRAAVDALGLWELPWMCDKYADERLGLECEDRWKHPNAPKRKPLGRIRDERSRT